MDRARIEAILSGKPAGRGKKKHDPKPIFKADDKVSACMGAITRLCAAPGKGHRAVELASSQLPPIF